MGHFKSAESATIEHGIVKPSKSFFIFTGVALVVGIFFLYTKRFQITYDETGFTVRTLFRKPQTYAFADVETLECKDDGFLLRTKQRTLRLEKELYLGADAFLAQLQNHVHS